MRTLMEKSLVPIFLIGAIILNQLPTDALAKWRRNKNLPGLVSMKSLVLIGVGTVGAIFLLAKASKSSKDSMVEEQENSSLNKNALTSATQSAYTKTTSKKVTSEPRVALFVDVNDYGV